MNNAIARAFKKIIAPVMRHPATRNASRQDARPAKPEVEDRKMEDRRMLAGLQPCPHFSAIVFLSTLLPVYYMFPTLSHQSCPN
jgi:hypothetical protein